MDSQLMFSVFALHHDNCLSNDADFHGLKSLSMNAPRFESAVNA